MKQYEITYIKLQYDEHGRLFMKYLRKVRTDDVNYLHKKEDEFFKTYNHETDIIAYWDMKRDDLYYYQYPLKRRFLTIASWHISSICSYPFELSDFMKRYIKKAR